MMFPPVAHLEAIDRATANSLLVAWQHKMGPLTRPNYTIEAHHGLFHHGQPIAVAMSGETVREVVGKTGIRRDQCVELVRLCAANDSMNRVMLRLWREVIFPDLASVHRRVLAVSYQDRDLHTGNTYRFDGWVNIGKGGGGGPDSRTGAPGRRMNIWAWPRDVASELMVQP
jgi:hypothetical protein